jgi:short-subunit dehydrogenase
MGVALAGARVLVTGASSGIGAALARAFAERGATVGLCARREDRLRAVLEACRRHTPGSRMWVTDLADREVVTRFALEADDALGGIDVLVNNAGMPKRRRLGSLTAADLDATITLNYLSPARMILALAPRMVERGRPAAIVNVGSVAARLASPGESAYDASKAALTAFTESLAVELADTAVSVHLVHPGVIDTELFDLPDNDPMPADEMERLPPSAVVDAVLAQLAGGPFEVFVPSWFGDVVRAKAEDIDGYLAGAAEYWRAKRQPGP